MAEQKHGGVRAAEALRRRGVSTLFGVPGEHVFHLLDGCLEAGIRVIDTRHEGAAALAAEGYALATGEVGVAVVTAGPGFANALVGLIDAGVWSVPLVLIAGRTGTDKEGRDAVMDVDQLAIASPVVKKAIRCTDPARIGLAVEEACYLARAGRPGAVYLEIPADVYAAADVEPAPGGFPGRIPVPAGDPADVDRAAELLRGAERPFAVVGTGGLLAGAGGVLARFAEAYGVPVATTSAARGLLPDGHPWCAGSLIHAGAALLSADVVLVLGSRFNGNLAFGRQPLFGPDQRVIQVDLDAEGLAKNRRPDVTVVGDVARVLEALVDRDVKLADERRGWLERARTTAAALRATWDQQIDGHDGDAVHAGAAVRELVGFIDDAAAGRATLVADGGDALAWALAYGRAEGPGRLLSTTTALGTLGVGLPFALAAKAARPDEPVFLFTGDGAFGLSAMELDTSLRHDLPVIVVVSNNAAWVDVVHGQTRHFGPDRVVASRLRATRYDRLAEALGCHGEHVTTLGELRPALQRSLDSGAPAVVNVVTDPAVLSLLLQNIGELDVM